MKRAAFALLLCCGCQQILGIEAGERRPSGSDPTSVGGQAGAGGLGSAGGGGVGAEGGGGIGGGAGQGGCADPTQLMVFVTVAEFPANLGSEGFDRNCAMEAASNCGDKEFVAWISKDEARARSAGTEIAAGAWSRPDGMLVATNNSDLTDGTILMPIDVHADGSPGSGYDVWTGTATDGTPTGINDCSGWTSNDMAFTGLGGLNGSADDEWTTGAMLDCDGMAHLYCFEAPPGS